MAWRVDIRRWTFWIFKIGHLSLWGDQVDRVSSETILQNLIVTYRVQESLRIPNPNICCRSFFSLRLFLFNFKISSLVHFSHWLFNFDKFSCICLWISHFVYMFSCLAFLNFISICFYLFVKGLFDSILCHISFYVCIFFLSSLVISSRRWLYYVLGNRWLSSRSFLFTFCGLIFVWWRRVQYFVFQIFQR